VAPADAEDDVVSGDAGEGLDAGDGAAPDDRPSEPDAPVFDAAMGMDP
jgi:hypothetical protein